MTVSTTSNSVTHEGNDAATVFDFDFPIPLPSTNLVLYFTDDEENTNTVPVNQYSVSGLGDPDGGSVTYPLSGPPIAAGTSITISRELPIVQETALINQGGYYPATVEAALDYLTMLIQGQEDEIGRAIRLPVTVDLDVVSPILEDPQSLKLLGWNSDGTRLINYDLVSVEIFVPGPDTVSTSTIQDGAVTIAKLAAEVFTYIFDTVATMITDAIAGLSLSIAVSDEGTPQGDVTVMNFVGAGVTATVVGSTATITIPGAGSDSGLVVQVQRDDDGELATGTTAMPWDDTIPQNTEGDQYMSVSITPTSAGNNLRVTVLANFAAPTNNYLLGAIFRDGGTNALAAGVAVTETVEGQIALQCVVAAGSTSATTFKFRAGGSSSITLSFNGHSGARKLGGVSNSFIQVEEITT